MEAQRITIALTDYSAGFKATPDWGRWGDWAVLSADVATFLRGEIQDSGGITKANAHIMLPDGRTLKVTTERAHQSGVQRVDPCCATDLMRHGLKITKRDGCLNAVKQCVASKKTPQTT